ncbi:MAG: cytochrome c [Alphaproteobacteria bacterium]|nr:cytochrome c [Alphaproteobacteria bacterium]
MLRAVAAVALGLVSVAASLALADPGSERKVELLYRLRHDCGSCHGMTLKGGLGPPLLPAALAGRPDDALIDVILHGIPDSPMPPWAFEIDRDEVAWLVTNLKKGLPDAE